MNSDRPPEDPHSLPRPARLVQQSSEIAQNLAFRPEIGPASDQGQRPKEHSLREPHAPRFQEKQAKHLKDDPGGGRIPDEPPERPAKQALRYPRHSASQACHSGSRKSLTAGLPMRHLRQLFPELAGGNEPRPPLRELGAPSEVERPDCPQGVRLCGPDRTPVSAQGQSGMQRQVGRGDVRPVRRETRRTRRAQRWRLRRASSENGFDGLERARMQPGSPARELELVGRLAEERMAEDEGCPGEHAGECIGRKRSGPPAAGAAAVDFARLRP
jgi:hypothetical protein